MHYRALIIMWIIQGQASTYWLISIYPSEATRALTIDLLVDDPHTLILKVLTSTSYFHVSWPGVLAGSVATVVVFDYSFDNAFLLKSALMHEKEKKKEKRELRPYACYAFLIIIMSVSLNIFLKSFVTQKPSPAWLTCVRSLVTHFSISNKYETSSLQFL